jgi:hypothetical protein
MGNEAPSQISIDDFAGRTFPKDKQLLRGKRVGLLNQIPYDKRVGALMDAAAHQNESASAISFWSI